MTSDFEKAGVFHEDGPSGSDILVRPAQEGSFLIEVVRVVTENWDTGKKTVAAIAAATGTPSLSTMLWWSTNSMRADVKDFSYLDNGNVKGSGSPDRVAGRRSTSRSGIAIPCAGCCKCTTPS
jgi:hypothetical protein